MFALHDHGYIIEVSIICYIFLHFEHNDHKYCIKCHKLPSTQNYSKALQAPLGLRAKVFKYLKNPTIVPMLLKAWKLQPAEVLKYTIPKQSLKANCPLKFNSGKNKVGNKVGCPIYSQNHKFVHWFSPTNQYATYHPGKWHLYPHGWSVSVFEKVD